MADEVMKPFLLQAFVCVFFLCPNVLGHSLGSHGISDYYNLELPAGLEVAILQEIRDSDFLRLLAFVNNATRESVLQVTAELDFEPDESLGSLSCSVTASGGGAAVDEKVATTVLNYIKARARGFSKLYCTVWLAQRELSTRVGFDAELPNFIAKTYPHVAPFLLRRDPVRDGAVQTGMVVYRISDEPFEWVYTVTVDVTGKPISAREERHLIKK